MREDFEKYAPEIDSGLTDSEVTPAPDAEEEKPTLSIISAEELENADLPPIQFIVTGLITHGLTLIASPPKFGKSWLVLLLCICVSMGWRFLGYKTNACRCLYLALEDSKQRLQSRLKTLLDGERAPKNFDFAVSCHSLDDGLIDELNGYVNEHQDAGLIVIDTLQKVRGAVHGREGAYAADYREMAELKAFADERHIALVLVHHLRKMGDDGDPFNRISGTNGIFGAADTAMVLTRQKRGDAETVMSVVGRDTESAEIILRFDKDSGKWINEGEADDVFERKALETYRCNPIVITVKKLLEQNTNKQWSGTATELMNSGKYIAKMYLATSVKALAKEITAIEKAMYDNDGIIHRTTKNGNAGAIHHFSYRDNPQMVELPADDDLPFIQ